MEIQLGTIIGAALNFVEVRHGFGRHARSLSAHDLKIFRKYAYGEWIQTFATLMWTKVSVCLFLLRIPTRAARRLRRPLQCAVAFLILSNTVITTVWIMQCQPLSAAWDNEGDGRGERGRCMGQKALEELILAQAIISAASDFAFAALPGLFLWRTQIETKTRLGLWGLMGLGVATGVFCLVRTVLNDEALPPGDPSYGGIVNWVWRLFEVQVGIIAACVPTLRPLYLWTVRWVKGEGRSLDKNIKVPLGGGKTQPWVECVDRAEKGRGTSKGRRDTMHDDLVKEGIISEEQQRDVIPPNKTDAAQKGEGQNLRHELQKYGIPDLT
ncbi:MAG: hypothetical protein LQ342_006033 [Letrouitia transgressa]|nr:MAG: hypothetical protein LQ342_006033 [Letrouitia transgressa]